MVFGIFTYAKRLNDLFADAVTIWLVLGDEDALEVATNAVVTAAGKQRETMIHFAATALEPLGLISEQMGGIPTSVSRKEMVELPTVEERLQSLLDKLAEAQGVSLMQARKAMKRENEKAVQKADVAYFRFRYPDFPLWADPPENHP